VSSTLLNLVVVPVAYYRFALVQVNELLTRGWASN
jgi:hypothetical protein